MTNVTLEDFNLDISDIALSGDPSYSGREVMAWAKSAVIEYGAHEAASKALNEYEIEKFYAVFKVETGLFSKKKVEIDLDQIIEGSDETLLARSIRNQKYEISRYLLKNGATVNVSPRSYFNHFNSYYTRDTQLEYYLIKSGAKFEGDEVNLLCNAAKHDEIFLEYLLDECGMYDYVTTAPFNDVKEFFQEALISSSSKAFESMQERGFDFKKVSSEYIWRRLIEEKDLQKLTNFLSLGATIDPSYSFNTLSDARERNIDIFETILRNIDIKAMIKDGNKDKIQERELELTDLVRKTIRSGNVKKFEALWKKDGVAEICLKYPDQWVKDVVTNSVTSDRVEMLEALMAKPKIMNYKGFSWTEVFFESLRYSNNTTQNLLMERKDIKLNPLKIMSKMVTDYNVDSGKKIWTKLNKNYDMAIAGRVALNKTIEKESIERFKYYLTECPESFTQEMAETIAKDTGFYYKIDELWTKREHIDLTDISYALFRAAIKDGANSKVKYLIKHGVEVNEEHIMLAYQERSSDVFKTMIDIPPYELCKRELSQAYSNGDRQELLAALNPTMAKDFQWDILDDATIVYYQEGRTENIGLKTIFNFRSSLMITVINNPSLDKIQPVAIPYKFSDLDNDNGIKEAYDRLIDAGKKPPEYNVNSRVVSKHGAKALKISK